MPLNATFVACVIFAGTFKTCTQPGQPTGAFASFGAKFRPICAANCWSETSVRINQTLRVVCPSLYVFHHFALRLGYLKRHSKELLSDTETEKTANLAAEYTFSLIYPPLVR
jgi:hypothetical protein